MANGRSSNCVFHRFLIRGTQFKTEAKLNWNMCQAGVVAQQRWVCILCDSQCVCSEAHLTYQTDTTNLGGCYSTIGRELAEVFYLVRLCPALLSFWINCKMCNWTNSFFLSTASLWCYGSRSQVHVQHTLVYKLLSHPWGNSVFKVGWVGRWW